MVTTSRQIAVGTELEVSGKVGDQKTRHQFRAVVMFNSINLMYISLSVQKGSVPPVAKMAQLTLRFKPPRDKGPITNADCPLRERGRTGCSD